MASGRPCLSSRCVSRRAKPRSSVGTLTEGLHRFLNGRATLVHALEQSFELLRSHGGSLWGRSANGPCSQVGCSTVPDLTQDQLTLALAIVAELPSSRSSSHVVALIRLRKARKEYMLIRGEAARGTSLRAVGRAMQATWTRSTRGRTLSGLRRSEQTAVGRFALQRFHMVRYDAFEDMGGRLSLLRGAPRRSRRWRGDHFDQRSNRDAYLREADHRT